MGTLTGAALIVGVRLSVATPEVVAAPPAVDLAGASAAPKPKPTRAKPAEKQKAKPEPDSGLTDGVFKGNAAANPYGKIQVSIRIADGRITAADATYPTTADSARINPPAVAKLKQATLQAQSAEVDAVSGATFTSESYIESLQAALDAAGA